MHTLRTRRVLLTPRVLEFTSEKFGPSPCASRDLSCFFEPLSPACDLLEAEVGQRRAARALANASASASTAASPSTTSSLISSSGSLPSKAPSSSSSRPGGKRAKSKPSRSFVGGREWPALPRALLLAREGRFVTDEARDAHRVPGAYAGRGWFWWSSHLLAYLLRPNAALARDVASTLEATGLHKALGSGRLIIGMHVRHGDACRSDEIVRARRSCTPLSVYMAMAARMLAQRGGGSGGTRMGGSGMRMGGDGKGSGATTGKPIIYLATDSLLVIQQSRAYASHFEIVYVPQQKVARVDPKLGEPLLWDRRVWMRFFWGQTDWTQHMAWMATIEMLLLAHADIFIGKFTSNIFRAAYSLRAAYCDCAPLFASLDAPMCFDYGVRSGRNWEFPTVNTSLGVRDRADATFQC